MNQKRTTKTNYQLTLLFVIGYAIHAFCQPSPMANSIVNQTSVYFEDNFKTTAFEYELSLFMDSTSVNSNQAFVKTKNKVPAFWVSNLSWNTSYYWKVTAFSKNKEIISDGELRKFSIMKIKFQGYDKIKMDVKTNLENEHNKGFICVDYTRSIYDRKGNPVWTIPNIIGIINENTQVRDLNVTRDNTITFITSKCGVEIDFYGNVLWKTPFSVTLNNVDTVSYHHDFKKTNRGTYMILADKIVKRKIIGTYPEQILKKEGVIKTVTNELFKNSKLGVLLEFNNEGKLLWYWDVNDYITDEDLNYKKNNNGFPILKTHDNAFSENKEGTKVYMGFKELNRVIKIDKKTKKVELTYGEQYPSGDGKYAHNLFKNQHDAQVSNHNSIYIFSNGSKFDKMSSVIELKDNLKSKKDTPCVWKFDLNFDTLSRGKSANGGKISELPNTNLLVCAGELNRVFEVTKTKKIVWDAFLWTKTINDSAWMPMSQYRCSWVKQLNQFHFLTQIVLKEQIQINKSIEIAIYNTGNAEDSYLIEVFSTNNQLYQTKTTSKVPANASYTEILKLETLNNTNKPNYVIIKSKNSSLFKKITLP